MSSKHGTSSQLAVAFMRLAPRLRAAGRRLLGSSDEADDAMQDTFVKLWSAASAADVNDGLVMTAMRNTCIDALRRRHPQETIEESAVGHATVEADSSDVSDLYGQVSRIIERHLSARDREILLLRDRDGYEMDAIAERMDMTEANVRVILSRARRAVREAYRQINSKTGN